MAFVVRAQRVIVIFPTIWVRVRQAAHQHSLVTSCMAWRVQNSMFARTAAFLRIRVASVTVYAVVERLSVIGQFPNASLNWLRIIPSGQYV